MDASWFLETLFGLAVGKDAQLAVWTLPDRDTMFFGDTTQASVYAVNRSAEADVYFGVGLYRPGISKGRGKAEDVQCITSVWADIDFGASHKKHVPPDIDTARAVIDRVGKPASIIVHSGHGLHVYWLLTEEVLVSDDAAELARRWDLTVRSCARAMGYEVDATGDLARVLRIPGTSNRKFDPALPVRVISSEADASRRYDSDDLLAWCVADEHAFKVPGAVQVGAVILDPQAEPPSLKFAAFRENDIRFRRTFDLERKDLKDQSPSSYDQALANFAVMAQWTDQEVANLIIAFRRQNKLDLAKAMRRDYIQRTIATARSGCANAQAATELSRIPPPKPTNGSNNAPQSAEQTEQGNIAVDVQATLIGISRTLGFDVIKWIQHGKEAARYSLVLKDGTDVLIGSADDVLNQRKFRARVLEGARRVMPALKPSIWTQLCAHLTSIVDLVENVEGTREGKGYEWLGQYLGSCTVFVEDDWQQAVTTGAPFVRSNRLYVNSNEFMKYVRMKMDERVEQGTIHEIFRACGFASKNISARIGHRVSNRAYWRDMRGEFSAHWLATMDAKDPEEEVADVH